MLPGKFLCSKYAWYAHRTILYKQKTIQKAEEKNFRTSLPSVYDEKGVP